MRLSFIGCVEFSSACLNHLLKQRFSGVEVVGVATRESSSTNSDFRSLEPLARAYGLPTFVVQGTDQAPLAEWLRSCQPDVVLCLGWSSLLKRCVLSVPPKGVVGYHPAALPKNRGRHPIIWTLALGLTETASTFFFMDEGADSGDLLSQETIAVEEWDNAGSLYRKLTDAALNQITAFVPALVSGRYSRIPQDHSRANYWRRRSRSDGQIDWRMPARSISNLVRALSPPYPGAHCLHQGTEVKIWKAEPSDLAGPGNLEPGKVLTADRTGITVKCGAGVLKITKHEFGVVPAEGSYL